MADATQPLQFKQAFWGTDFTNYDGFEALHKRMKEGKQFTDDFTSYIKQRAAIEETYGKALIKLGRSAGGATEIGSLRTSWEALKAETEELGNIHYRQSQQLGQELETPNREFREKQRMQRKKTEDVVRKAQKLKLNSYNSNQKARKHYESKCREAERADEEVKKGNYLPPKDLDKLRSKATKARAAAEAADAAYQEAVRQLDETRQLWEQEMTRCCVQFQQAEEERVAFLRNAMWFYTNCCSAACVTDDQRYEAMRLVLEKCDVSEVIQQFITTKSTGFERPAPIKYHSFYSTGGEASVAADSPGASGGFASKITGRISRALGSGDDGKTPVSRTNSSASAAPAPSSTVITEAPTPEATEAEEIVLVSFDYEAQGDQELSLKKGDLVTVLGKMDDTWWRGKVKGKVGMFPRTFVGPLETP